MSFPKLMARYAYRAPYTNVKGLSYEQLLALHVAAKYMLRWYGSRGWLADVPHPPMVHAFSTIRSLVKRGLLEGDSYALNGAMRVGNLDGRRATLWITAKGKTLLEEVATKTGWVFDEANYELISNNEPEYRWIQAKDKEEKDVERDSFDLGTFEHGYRAGQACDEAAILLYGDDAQTRYPLSLARTYRVLPTK